jgi:RNA polymerase sigma-70 factor (ECF subfamily)
LTAWWVRVRLWFIRFANSHRERRGSSPSGKARRLSNHEHHADESLFEEQEYRRQLLLRALTLQRDEIQPATWKAFQEPGLNGRRAAQVAGQLAMTVGAVYAAKCRVLGRLREQLRGLLD